MLTTKDNELLVKTAGGTPMGRLIRRYWVPALLSAEVAQADGPPVRVRLLGEELVAFRDSQGRVGLMNEHCSHRGVSLVLGRCEEGGSTAVVPVMKAQGKGVIVNIASGAGRGASPGQAAYGAAKAAVINMSMSMAIEWGPEIRVNSIAIGAIDSPHRPTWAGDAGAGPDLGARTALGRLGTQEEVAGIVTWLASDHAGFVTGSVIDAHGGRR